MKSRLYPNGFLFTQEEVITDSLPDYYDTHRILDTYNYIFDQNTKVHTYIENDRFIIIHGLFVHLDYEVGNITDKSPKLLVDLFFYDKKEFLEELNFCGGRFVIIVGDSEHFEVFPDASAMRTIYIEPMHSIISSHINLLTDTFDFSSEKSEGINIGDTKLWDTTQFDNIRSLNPNFFYSSRTKETTRFFPNKINKYNNMTLETKLENFEFLWQEQLKYFKNRYDSVIFSITGGADSRVSLALAKNYMQEFQFFTYAPSSNVKKYSTRFLRSLSKDKEIVDQLLEVVPLNHNYLLFKEQRKVLEDKDIEILDMNSPYIHGRFLLPYYNYFFPKDSTLHIRGNLFEIGRAFFINRYSKNDQSDVYKIVFQSMKKSADEDFNRNSADENIKYNIKKFNYDKDNFGYHVLDLYYWEIRMGRWMAEVLNETDYSFETLLPFNMREIMDISLSFNIKERKNNFLFDELINRNYPILNFFGKNDPRNLYEQKSEMKTSKVVNDFNVYRQGEFVQNILTNSSEIYIPKENMGKNNYVETVFEYKAVQGHLKLLLQGKYKNSNAINYLKYQILINETGILEEDIALWNQETDIVITGLKKNDKVRLRIISKRKSNTLSWEKASAIKVLGYKEIYSGENLPLDIYSNSPFSNKK